MNLAEIIEMIGKLSIVLFLSFIFVYMIYSTASFEKNYSERQISSIEQIIDRALVQCYALEGQYPVEVEQVEKYGVIFDRKKYFYFYEWYGGNIKPSIMVIKK